MSAGRAVRPWFNLGGLVGSVWAAMIAAAPVKIWAQVGAAMATTLSLMIFGAWIRYGPWLAAHQAQQIEWLGRGMVMATGLTLVALAAITGLSINFHGGKDGFTGSLDRDPDAPDPLKVTTTTRTTIEGAGEAGAPIVEPRP